MKILIADDEPISLQILSHALVGWGFDVASVSDGSVALHRLQESTGPKLAILDWTMPGVEGVEICQRLRAIPNATPTYIILLTARNAKSDIVAGLAAGANDFISKPFDRDELRARVMVGRTVVELQTHLAERVKQLEESLAEVKQLKELLPICSYCRKIRDDNNYWESIESYLKKHANVRMSHGVCETCFDELMKRESGDPTKK